MRDIIKNIEAFNMNLQGGRQLVKQLNRHQMAQSTATPSTTVITSGPASTILHYAQSAEPEASLPNYNNNSILVSNNSSTSPQKDKFTRRTVGSSNKKK